MPLKFLSFIRKLAIMLAAALVAAGAAVAQRPPGDLRTGPGSLGPNVLRQIQHADAYDIELSNGRKGQFFLPGFWGEGSITGTAFGDSYFGRRAGAQGPIAWVTYRNGRPHEAYQATFVQSSGYWVGTAYGIDASSDLSTPQRNAWAFRARLSLTVTGRGAVLAPRPAPPPLVNPPGIARGAQPYSFAGAVERTYPIRVSNQDRGFLVISVASNGAVTGRIANGQAAAATIAYDTVTGHYSSASGRIAMVRQSSASQGQQARPLEVITGVLPAGSDFTGDIFHLVASQVPLQQSWQTGSMRQFANFRHGGCLTVPDDSMAPGAELWLNTYAIQPCSNAGPSGRWAFTMIASSGSRAVVALVNLHSGLCMTSPSEPGGRFTQDVCLINNRSSIMLYGARSIQSGATSTITLDPISDLTQLDLYDATVLEVSLNCPGATDSQAPWIYNVCGPAGATTSPSERYFWRSVR